ncbi:hypothetical protein, partial [Oryzifoliimicrobium ureilyticus]|uniref:hypothetical protein n=1 Tax=Oryzifoliimicrobium ureilyticus TaxID=3113724 RepID=UPI0030764E1F
SSKAKTRTISNPANQGNKIQRQQPLAAPAALVSERAYRPTQANQSTPTPKVFDIFFTRKTQRQVAGFWKHSDIRGGVSDWS